MGAHSTAHQPRRGKGKHRAQTESSIERYALLGAGAITLGVGAALASGAGVASAETSDTNDAPSAQPAADKQADKEKGSKPADGADKKKPESKFGSGRDATDTDKPDAASKVGATVRNEIKRAAKTADEVRTKVSDAVDKLADATELSKPATPAVPDVAKPVSTKKWPDPFAVVRDVVTDDDAVVDKTPEPTNDVLAAEEVAPADGPVPWSPNPFRPMPPEPEPVNMPPLIYGVEQTFVDAFEGVPGFQPFVREGFELGFRATQMVPWVNAALPVINIVGQLPNVTSGDAETRKDATQSIVNNLLVTIHPVSVAFYGYDEIADLLNVEYEGQQLKVWFYTTSWNLLDPFELLHNKDQSGLPLYQTSSTSTLESTPSVGRAASFGALAVVGDEPGTSPFRPEDPDPKGMPEGLLSIRNGVMDVLPDELSPIYREAFEAVYRGSQMVPYVNAVVPITEILPALAQAANGDKAGAQVAINQLILTTGPVSLLYYGYDQIADLLNVETAAYEAKKQLYIGLWDGIDSTGALHPLGQSGLPA